MGLPDCMYDYRYERKKAIPVDMCKRCEADIYTDQVYYDFDGEILCERCGEEYISENKKIAN